MAADLTGAPGSAEDTTAELLRLARLAADCYDPDRLRGLNKTAEGLILPVVEAVIRELTKRQCEDPKDELTDLFLEETAAEIIGNTPAGLAYLDVASNARRRKVL